MRFTQFSGLSLLLIFFLMYSHVLAAKVNPEDQHNKVIMRMIGHEILLQACDSSSHVLPIEGMDGRYKIGFESDFQFNPEALVYVIDSIITRTQIACHYIVEVADCEEDKIVYSFEMIYAGDQDLIPCRSRDTYQGCYVIFISILEKGQSLAKASSAGSQPGTNLNESSWFANSRSVLIQLIPAVLILMVLYFMFRKKRRIELPSDLIHIGKYRLDMKNMMLLYGESRTELTSTEADLLALLHNSANDTIERDVILAKVWGDKGDYVGRTLDVFISKLRAKLGSDESIRIVNIRGRGYKLVLND